MRPIKFRAYHPDSGMKYFMLNQIKGGTVLFDDGDWRSLNDCQVMQFTGLHDKNGKEIYEGDILHWGGLPLPNDDILNWVGLTFPIIIDDFNEYRFMFGKYQLCRAFANNGEVIANIYENPEQLEKEKK